MDWVHTSFLPFLLLLTGGCIKDILCFLYHFRVGLFGITESFYWSRAFKIISEKPQEAQTERTRKDSEIPKERKWRRHREKLSHWQAHCLTLTWSHDPAGPFPIGCSSHIPTPGVSNAEGFRVWLPSAEKRQSWGVLAAWVFFLT